MVHLELHFNLNSKYFRKLISDFKNFKALLTIEKLTDEPLTLSYSSKNKQVKATHRPSNSEKFKIHSKLSENDIFSISLNTTYVKPVSGNILSDHIELFFFDNKPVLCKRIIDDDVSTGVIEVKTLISIIDFTQILED